MALRGKGVVKQRPAGKPGGAAAKPVSGAGKVKLLVKAKGKRRAKLDRKGTVKLKAKVAFTPRGGGPGTQLIKIRLKKTLLR